MMQKTRFFLVGFVLILSIGFIAYKPILWTVYILLGEQKHVQRYGHRGQLSASEQEKLYHDSCRYFLKAYQIDKKRFDYTKSGTAYDNCLEAGDRPAAEIFRVLQTQLPKRDVSADTHEPPY